MDRNEQSDLDRNIAQELSGFRADAEWQPSLGRGLAILQERRAVSRERRRRWSFLAAGVAAACLPIAAFPAARTFAARCVTACVQETAAVRARLLGRTSSNNAFVKASDRKAAPDFDLTDSSGRHIRLSGFRGEVVLVNFWATQCSPCNRQMPWFAEFQQADQQRGLEVLGISMDQGGWSTVKPYLEAKNINYPVVLGNDRVATEFGGLATLPLTLVIDREGRVAAIHAGLCRKDEYESDLNAVLNER